MHTRFPRAILAIGRNYADHAAEMGGRTDERPMVFMKNPASACGPSDTIVIPPICQHGGPQVDYEGELAFEIGQDCRDVPESDALSVLAGYRVANDVSARWWQKEGSGGQFCRGKSFDTFCPLGPLVPAADIPDPHMLAIETILNGARVQHSNTSMMVFRVPYLIAELSRGMTLLAGTIVLTGTPAGVGAGRKPPLFLKDGDVIEVKISGVGQLRNLVREA
jgi:2-keto-4-pentenoate hydratase/2-oxohepta-3-ene-1,7-dioic acid hydratase in catechol pathway